MYIVKTIDFNINAKHLLARLSYFTQKSVLFQMTKRNKTYSF